MARYIDIDKYKKFGCGNFFGDCRLIKKDFSCIDCYYSDGGKEDVRPIVHAKWKKINVVEINGNKHELARCTNCTEKKSLPYGMHFLFDYCPYCGAKMDKE